MAIGMRKNVIGGNRWLNFLYVLLTCIPWVIILLASFRGFDLTDKSFYLMSYAHPKDITATFSMFSVIGKPLYDLSSGNIAILRLLGMVIWLISAGVTSWITLSFLSSQPLLGSTNRFSAEKRFLLTLLLCAAASQYYLSWLLTPNYNLMTLIGIALFWTGILLWLKTDYPARVNHLGSFLFAIAATLVFWSKATSAALLPLIPIAMLIVNRSRWRRLLGWQNLIAGAVGFCLGISAPFWSGLSVQDVLNTLTQGIKYQTLLKPGSYAGLLSTVLDGFRQIWEFFLGDVYLTRYAVLWLAPLIMIALLARFAKNWRSRRLLFRLLLVLGWVANLTVVSAIYAEGNGYWSLNVVLLTFAFLAVGSYAQPRRTGSGTPSQPLKGGWWAIVIFSLVFIFVFGTSNSYSLQSGMAVYFSLFGVSVFLLAVEERTLNATFVRIVVPALLVAMIVLTYTNSLTPYRQDESIWRMDQTVLIRNNTTTLLVSDSMANYLRELQQMASAAGFQPETQLIDLTGHTPGAAYVLDGRAFGFPWLLGGYPGADAAAVYILEQWQPNQLSCAWILTVAQHGERALSPTILSEVGLNFPTDYEQIGTLRRPASAEIQTLWRPLTHCEHPPDR